MEMIIEHFDLSAFLNGLLGIITGVIFNYVPRLRKEKFQKLQKELLEVYKDVESLIQIESELLQKSNMSKIQARKGFTISKRCEPKRLANRIKELESK